MLLPLLSLLPQQQLLLLLLIILYVCYIAHAPTAVLTLMYTLSVLIKLSGSFKIQNKKTHETGKGCVREGIGDQEGDCHEVKIYSKCSATCKIFSNNK